MKTCKHPKNFRYTEIKQANVGGVDTRPVKYEYCKKCGKLLRIID